MKIFFLLLIISLQVHCDDESIAKKAYQANINALMIFTSQDGLNTGHYRFTKIGVEMDIYHLPFLYHLKSSYENINFFVMGNIGYSRTKLDDNFLRPVPHETPVTLNYQNQLRTYTGGLGIGIRYHNDYGFNILTGIEMIYSRTGIKVLSADDDLGDAIKDFFDGNYNNNLTYKFLLSFEYRKEYRGFHPYAVLNYKLYETKTDFSLDELMTFSTQASVSTFGFGTETPHLYDYKDMYLTLEGYLYGHYLSGDITNISGFDTYYTFGVVAYWNTPQRINWAERFFLEASTVNSTGLEGYNVGIGFTVDF